MARAQALGLPVKFTTIAVGDGNGEVPTPSRDRTALVNEVRRAPINTINYDPLNPGQFVAEQVVPEDVGGFWIRELGLLDENGTLCYYGNCPPTYKPVLAEGSGRVQNIRMVCLNTGGVAVELKIDPSIVLATRQYVDTAIADALTVRDAKQSVRVATTGNLPALSGLLTVDTIPLAAGDRVLVKDQAAAKDNGIYVVAAGAWTRATDADTGLRLTPGAVIPVEAGTVNADSVWQLTTDGAIIVGATPLAFQRVGDGHFAPLKGAAFVDTPTAPTAPQFDKSTKLATMQAVQRALGNRADCFLYTDSRQITAAQFGSYIEFAGNASATWTLPAASAYKGGSFEIYNGANTPGVNLTLTGGGTFYGPNASGVPSLTLAPQVSVTIISDGTNWKVLNGAGQLFIGTNVGVRKDANGLIEQWGFATVPNSGNTTSSVSVTFPQAFPNACLNIVGVFCEAFNNTGGGSWAVRPSAWTKVGFTATGDNNGPNYPFNKPAGFFWRALGH